MAKHYQPSAVLRDNAKGFLNGKYGMTVGSTFLYMGLYWALSQIATGVSAFFEGIFIRSNLVNMSATLVLEFIQLIISAVLTIVLGVVSMGMSFYYLKIGVGQRPRVSDVFYAFREDFKKSFTASFYVNILLILSILPAQIVFDIYRNTKDTKYIVYMIPCVIVGLILYIFFDISLKMTYYIMADFPEYSTWDAVKASWNKMSGNRMRLFGLMLSLLPYYILGILSFGVGLFWVFPFAQESYVQFYLDLMNPKVVTGEWERTV